MRRVPGLASFVRNMSVTWKFVAVYLTILALSLLVSGLYLYQQLSASAIVQAQAVMERNLLQTRDSILDKVKMVEDISRLFTSDIKLQTFLSEDFEGDDPLQFEFYRTSTVPFVENIIRQNPFIHSMRIYMYNPTIPEVYDSFYSLDRIRDQEWVTEAMHSENADSGWRGIHEENMIIRTPAMTGGNQEVFSYVQQINSIRYSDSIALLEVEVKEGVLFDVLRAESTEVAGRVFAISGDGMVVSRNLEELQGRSLSDLGIEPLPTDTVFNDILTVHDEASIVISVPMEPLGLRLVGVFPENSFNGEVKESARSIAAILLIALTVLGVLVYVMTNAMLSRLKVLVKAMKQVREGKLEVSVPVKSNDEFSLIAGSFNLMTERIHSLVETVYKIELMEREAELRALEAQVNPHFLYNTLATISWVARKAKADDIVQISNALAQFYRLVLNKGRSEILVKGELDMVKAYLNIQKFRFEDMFDVIYDIDERVYEHAAVKNILQPLIENALVHGIEPKRSHGTLIVKAGFDGDMLYYSVIDDGVGLRQRRIADIMAGAIDRTAGSGYAVKNIMDRLKGYYGDQYEFHIHSRPGIGTAVVIKFGKGRQ